MAPTFKILIEKRDGETIKAFTWCRDASSGIARAEKEAKEFGIEWVAIYAVAC
jgi:hypothetical protein